MGPVFSAFTVTRYRHTRYWAVRDRAGQLICVCVYKRGALEVARRLEAGSAYRLEEAPPEAQNRSEAVREQVREPSKDQTR